MENKGLRMTSEGVKEPGEVTLPASLRLGTRVPFPPNPLTKHSFAPRESGAYHLPKFPTR